MWDVRSFVLPRPRHSQAVAVPDAAHRAICRDLQCDLPGPAGTYADLPGPTGTYADLRGPAKTYGDRGRCRTFSPPWETSMSLACVTPPAAIPYRRSPLAPST